MSTEATDLPPALRNARLPEITRPFAARLSTEVADHDAMFAGNHDHYFSCGASALACILHAAGLCGTRPPARLLDFGCGAGRVTRWLRAAFPDADIHGCDIRQPGLEFVQRTYGATTWVSGTDVGALNAPVKYDLIWVGSVFTHLSAETSRRLFDKLMSWLLPKGLLVLSTHGRFVLHRAGTGDNIYGLGGEAWLQVVQGYEATGFGYADYPPETGNEAGYGISLSSSAWWVDLIEGRSGTRLCCLTERAWDEHHDVIAAQVTGWD